MPLWGGPDGAPPMLAPGGIARAGPRLPPNTGRLAGIRAAPAFHGVVRDGALSQNQYYLHSPSMQCTMSYGAEPVKNQNLLGDQKLEKKRFEFV